PSFLTVWISRYGPGVRSNFALHPGVYSTHISPPSSLQSSNMEAVGWRSCCHAILAKAIFLWVPRFGFDRQAPVPLPLRKRVFDLCARSKVRLLKMSAAGASPTTIPWWLPTPVYNRHEYQEDAMAVSLPPFVECEQLHPGLAVDHIATAVDFYTKKLGF